MIIIYTEQKTNRLEFICNQIFRHILGTPFIITEKEYDSQYPIIYYTEKNAGKGIHICPNGLLFENGIRNISPEISYWNNLPIFFQTSKSDIPFDIFAAAFYLLSRYEEYNEKELDKHGRYQAEKSLAFKYNFLELPIVDMWALELKKIIISQYPEYIFKSPKFQFIPTIDVDNIYAFRHKGPFINGYHLIKDLFSGKKAKAKYRFYVLIRKLPDPFFNLKKIISLHQDCDISPIFFFHCGSYGKYDKKTFVPSLSYCRIKKEISQNFIVGLHPSYHAAFSKKLFSLELKHLKYCSTNKHIYHNRFHYLRFRIPESYIMLSHLNIRHDWSMAYSSYPGFRAGTSFPFHFYNLNKETTYKLMIHPVAIMDKTLKSDLKLNNQEGKKYILKLAEKVQAVNGNLITIFHNENLTDAFDWKGWKTMYHSLFWCLKKIF